MYDVTFDQFDGGYIATLDRVITEAAVLAYIPLDPEADREIFSLHAWHSDNPIECNLYWDRKVGWIQGIDAIALRMAKRFPPPKVQAPPTSQAQRDRALLKALHLGMPERVLGGIRVNGRFVSREILEAAANQEDTSLRMAYQAIKRLSHL